ncbi:hypothetical protein ASF45_25065 [Pseudorhodoferax sp. Leaf265]|nr:hypothetical protein ASF45_25065 [Pseudorhodoferax sp. Leaf265]
MLLLAMVFWEIGEMPQVDVASIGPLLGTIALGGLAMTVALSVFAIVGGAVARFAFTVPESIGDRWVLVTYLLPASLVAASLSIFALAYPAWPKYHGSIPGWLTATGPVLAAVVVALRWKALASWKQAAGAWVALSWNSSALTVVASLLLVNVMPATTYERSSIRLAGVAFALWAIYFAMFVAFARRIQKPRQFGNLMVWAFVAATLVMTASNGWMAVAHLMLKRIGWGNLPAKMFVTDRGCEILNRGLGNEVCRRQPGSLAHLVCPVWVRSRIGTPVFVSVSALSASGSWPDHENLRHVSLPKEDVIVVQRIAAKPPQSEGEPQHDGLLKYLDQQASASGQWLRVQCGV